MFSAFTLDISMGPISCSNHIINCSILFHLNFRKAIVFSCPSERKFSTLIWLVLLIAFHACICLSEEEKISKNPYSVWKQLLLVAKNKCCTPMMCQQQYLYPVKVKRLQKYCRDQNSVIPLFDINILG